MTNNDAERFSRLLAQRLERLMQERGLSQNRLSKESGVSQSQISRILSYERSVSVDQLSAISGALGVSPWEVVKDAEDQMMSTPVLSVAPDTVDEWSLAANDDDEEPEQ